MISKRVRELLQKVHGGDDRVLPLIQQMCALPYRRKAQVFTYCIEHGIVGKHFYEVAAKNAFNPVRVYKAVIDKIDGAMATPLNRSELI